MDANNFATLTTLYDVTIPSLAPNSAGTMTPVAGAIGAQGQATYAFVTPNVLPNNSGAVASGLVAEALIVEVTSPVVQTAAGAIVYPDFNWWPVADQKDLQFTLNFDGSYGTNMMPNRESNVGRQQLRLGISLRRLLVEARNNHARPEMALKATGIKFVASLIAKLASTRGWGIAGDNVIVPARIRVWGERYNRALLDLLGGLYNPVFAKQTLRRELENLPGITGNQGGIVNMDGWTGLPGGYQQKGAVIHRYFNYASNLVQTGPQAAFLLTNNVNVGGAQGNVNQTNDLGFAFAATQGSAAVAKDALIVHQFGVAPGAANLAFAGIQIAGQNIPGPNGIPVGQAIDRLAYGQVGPIRNSSGLFYALPEYEGEMMVIGENAAVQITANGAAIAANAATVAIGGVRITLA